MHEIAQRIWTWKLVIDWELFSELFDNPIHPLKIENILASYNLSLIFGVRLRSVKKQNRIFCLVWVILNVRLSLIMDRSVPERLVFASASSITKQFDWICRDQSDYQDIDRHVSWQLLSLRLSMATVVKLSAVLVTRKSLIKIRKQNRESSLYFLVASARANCIQQNKKYTLQHNHLAHAATLKCALFLVLES